MLPDLDKYGLLSYDVSITQSADADASIGVDFTVPDGQVWFWVLHRVKLGLVGAARTVTITQESNDGNAIVLIDSLAIDDNQTLYGPHIKVSDESPASSVAETGITSAPHPIGANDKIEVRGASMANGEAMGVKLRVWVPRADIALITASRVIVGTNVVSSNEDIRVV